MKRTTQVIFWVFSVVLGIMALALLSSSALSSAMLLACAVLINPLFIEKIQLKKALTALLAIGLFIASVIVFPTPDEDVVQQNTVITARSAETISEESTAQGSMLRGITSGEKTADTSAEATSGIQITPVKSPTPKPTATPTVVPTPTPTSSPKPTPTIKPTETPRPVTRSVGIIILDYSDEVRRGSYAFIKIQGAPNTDYDCEVEYKTTMSSADGLGTKRSDENGIVSWRWKVGSRTSLDYSPTIYIDGGGDSISVQFDVLK